MNDTKSKAEVVEQFINEYDADPAYDLEESVFEQEHLDGKAWVDETAVVCLFHESVPEVGMVDPSEFSDRCQHLQRGGVTDDNDVLFVVNSDTTKAKPTIREDYRAMALSLFGYDEQEFEDAVRINGDYGDTYPVIVEGPGEYNALVAPFADSE
jgi:hypothetical protein